MSWHARVVPGIQANPYILPQGKLLPEVNFITNVLIDKLAKCSFICLFSELKHQKYHSSFKRIILTKGRPESSDRQGCGWCAVRWIWFHHTHLKFSIGVTFIKFHLLRCLSFPKRFKRALETRDFLNVCKGYHIKSSIFQRTYATFSLWIHLELFVCFAFSFLVECLFCLP